MNPFRLAEYAAHAESRRRAIAMTASTISFRRARPGELPGGRRHAKPPVAVASQRDDAVRQTVTAHVFLLQQLGRSGALEHARVLALVIVGRGRQWNQNRRPSRRRHFRQSRRARARDDEPRRFHLSVHRIDEPFHAALHALPFERLSNHIEIPRPRLADEIEGCGCGRQPRRRLHQGHVDCVRPLRAAKDQDPNPGSVECRVATGIISTLQELAPNRIAADKTLSRRNTGARRRRSPPRG